MPKASDREIEESFERAVVLPNEENLPILYHVLFDDDLHRGIRHNKRKDEDAQKDDHV